MTHAGRYRPRKMLTCECWACEQKFQATRPDARYCSEKCRKQASRLAQALKFMKQGLVSTNAPIASAKLKNTKPKPKR